MNWKRSRGLVETEAPSNIALVKYWGKKGEQLPANPSLSMTLGSCSTKAAVRFALSERETSAEPRLFFHGEPNADFLPKIETFIKRVRPLYPFVDYLQELEIRTENSFPHSSGIASSASAFAALALAFEEIHRSLNGEELDLRRASNAARLGSGSACRSLQGGFNLWGRLSEESGDDQCAVNLENVHPVFQGMRDAVAIVSSQEKSVGSSAGHSLMRDHPYSQARREQALANVRAALACLEEGDVWGLGEIVESEAMALHALMMTSNPSYMLMKPATLKILEMVKQFRDIQKAPVFFTLDAGPNPHILYLEKDREKVENILLQTIIGHCEKGRVIMDYRGEGPVVRESWFE